jgi:hypothetical protein
LEAYYNTAARVERSLSPYYKVSLFVCGFLFIWIAVSENSRRDKKWEGGMREGEGNRRERERQERESVEKVKQ